VSLILLTPNLSGPDGISTVARLVTRACEDVTVLALHEADRTTFDEVDVEGSGGRSSHFVTAATRWAGLGRSAGDRHRQPPASRAGGAGLRGARRLAVDDRARRRGVEAAHLAAAGRARPQRADCRRLGLFARSVRAANPHFAQRRIDVCHLGLEPIVTSQGPAEWVPSALIVGRMARDERYKGHDLLIDIWRDVASGTDPAAVPAASSARRRPARGSSRKAAVDESSAATGSNFLAGSATSDLAREYQRCTAVVDAQPRARASAWSSSRRCVPPVAASAATDRRPRSSSTEKPVFWSIPGTWARILRQGGGAGMLRDRTATAAMGLRGRARFLQFFTEDHFRQPAARPVA
jgi:hypothetical protein